MLATIIEYTYLISVILFVIGLKRLSSPDTARAGNLYASAGMGLAILASLIAPLESGDNNYAWIGGGIIVGGAIGYLAAKRVKLTQMPELVSLFNGLGGACAALISIVELNKLGDPLNYGQMITTVFALFVGSVSFTGSIIAWGKLNGSLRDNFKIPAANVVNSIILLSIIALSVFYIALVPNNYTIGLGLLALCLVYGVTFVTPIGGGDMPVMISLLNSLTGIGAALAGLIYDNSVMLVGGIIVGASGTILTILMCEAMNRSLLNVLIGGFGSSGGSAAATGDQTVKEATTTDLAIMLKYADKVMVVPGYGMAVAQAQHVVHEIEQKLTDEGVEFKYAIHPVAGRMPGHMNVLLAEADVSYDNLLEMEQANKEFLGADVVIVIGANDVVNPAAKTDSGSPIYGMPILEVEQAKNVVVLKRSMGAGYSGVQNQLFFHDKTRMLFGDAKKSLNAIKDEIDNV